MSLPILEVWLESTVFFRVVDAAQSVYRIENDDLAIQTAATSIIRSAAGKLDLDALQSSRDAMNQEIETHTASLINGVATFNDIEVLQGTLLEKQFIINQSKEWAYVMEVAHSIGIKSTATIMFGHIDDINSWTNHYSLIRQLQSRTRGFTEVVPLPFVHMGSPIYLQGKSMPGPTWDEIVLIHSLARIYFNTYIDNIQASWVKLGHDGASNLLKAGVNDLGGTLINENISRASGASHGQETTDHEFINLIKENNKKPYLRNTLYTKLKKIEELSLEEDVIKI